MAQPPMLKRSFTHDNKCSFTNDTASYGESLHKISFTNDYKRSFTNDTVSDVESLHKKSFTNDIASYGEWLRKSLLSVLKEAPCLTRRKTLGLRGSIKLDPMMFSLFHPESCDIKP